MNFAPLSVEQSAWLAQAFEAAPVTDIPSLLADFDAELPLDRARTIPAAWYREPALAELEARAVFASTWQPLGRRELVPHRGDFLTADVAGEPLLAVRGDDGIVRAFHNVCRHRAAPLLRDESGCVGKLRCRYHGWTYDLAGNLRGTPEFDGVCDFRKEENGLVPVSLAAWGPYLWVNLGGPREPAASQFAPLAESAFAGLTWHARTVYDVACNWKVYVDNYLDGGYHVNTVHPALAGVLDYAGYTTTTYANTALQRSPLKPSDGPAGGTRTGDAAEYWWAFPNVMFNLYAGVMDANVVVPAGPERCRVIFDFYFADGTADAFKAESLRVADAVQLEDVGICEEVQRGLRGRAWAHGRYSVKRENAEYAFHQTLARRLRAGSTR